jgi:thiol-disulfide isomerase/thioredoxin
MQRFRLDPRELPASEVRHVGLEAVMREGLRRISEAAVRQAREKGIEVLPLPQVGRPYEFALTTTDDRVVDSRRLQGKVLLIDCWASWCGPCIRDMPELKAVYRKWHGKGLEVLGVSLDDNLNAARAVVESHEIPWPLVVVPSDEETRKLWAEASRITEVPRILLIDQRGVLRADSTRPEKLDEEIAALLEHPSAPADEPSDVPDPGDRGLDVNALNPNGPENGNGATRASDAAQANDAPQANGASSSADAASAEEDESTSEAVAPEEPHAVLEGVVSDPEGELVAGASVRALTHGDVVTASPTDAQGRFQLRVPQSRVRGAILLAQWQNGSHQAMHDLGWQIDATEPLPAVQLVLRPARVVQVQVIDAEGRPVADASVGATVSGRRIAAARSDAQGRATLRVPPDATLKYVYAIKPNVGLDYVAYPDPIPSPEDDKAPEQAGRDEHVRFTLDGTVTVRVRLIDPENRPLVGIPVYPWYFQKPDKPDDFNVSGLAEVKIKTDARGVAAFDFIPAVNEGKITFWAHTPKHWAPERPMYDPESGQTDITVPMVRMVRVWGQVRFADGRPAPGTEVEAAGAGYQFDRFRGSTRTDADGNFELLVYPDQIYMFAVIDPKWAASVRDRIIVRPDTPVDGVDFQLQPGTKVHGRVTMGPEKKPLADQRMEVYQYGADLHGLSEDQQLPNPTESRRYVRPLITRSTRTDAEGRYEFCVGPGTYDIRGPAQTEIQKFSVEDQESITFDFQTPHEDMGLITGRVVRQEDSQPVVGAKVVGVPITERGHAQLEATTDQQGRFRDNHWLDRMLFYAETPDGKLKGVAEIAAGERQATIPVRPVTSARGRLLDQASREPLSDRKIEYGIRIMLPDGCSSDRFGGSVKTDASGRFMLEGLVAGQEYHLNAPLHDEDDPPGDRRWQTVGKFTAQGPAATDIGDLELKPPYRPPTLDERVTSAFGKKTALDERLQGALYDARLERKRVLVIFADPEGEPCRQLYHLCYEDSDAMRAFADYRLLPIRTGPGEDADSAAALAARLDVRLADDRQPTLCILDTDGQRLATRHARDLSKDGRIDRDLVTEFLQAHAPEPPDAEELLADALAQAKREDKRVLVQQTGAFCGPCLLLSRFLDRHKGKLAKDYVHVKIDESRWHNGTPVIKRLRTPEGRSIPWMAILDADGRVLITSDAPEGNIGFPVAAEEIEHFLKMLAATARHLDEADFSELRKALEDRSSR